MARELSTHGIKALTLIRCWLGACAPGPAVRLRTPAFRAAAAPNLRGRKPTLDAYGGSGHPLYGLSVPVRRSIAKRWLAANHGLPSAEVVKVVESLITGASHEEKTLACILLGYHRAARARHMGVPQVELSALEHLDGAAASHPASWATGWASPRAA